MVAGIDAAAGAHRLLRLRHTVDSADSVDSEVLVAVADSADPEDSEVRDLVDSEVLVAMADSAGMVLAAPEVLADSSESRATGSSWMAVDWPCDCDRIVIWYNEWRGSNPPPFMIAGNEGAEPSYAEGAADAVLPARITSSFMTSDD